MLHSIRATGHSLVSHYLHRCGQDGGRPAGKVEGPELEMGSGGSMPTPRPEEARGREKEKFPES